MLPLINNSNCQYADLFAKVYARWHKYCNLYSTTHEIPACFSDKSYPVFSVHDSAEEINSNPSKIKIFFNFHDSLRHFNIEHKPNLLQLRSDCVYIFVTGDQFSEEDYQITNSLGEKIHYVNICWPFFIYQTATIDFFDPILTFPSQNNDKFYDFRSEKTVDFISVIGNARLERTYLVKKIKKHLPKNHFAIGIANTLRGKAEVFDHDIVAERSPELLWGVRTAIKNTLALCDIPPIDLYNQARVKIVVETQIANDNVDNFFITEKTIKALFTGMPFLVYGSRGFLANLQSMGFMTYNSLWNEDYDLLPTWKERADAIVETLQDLLEFEWESVIPELERIHYHNLKTLINRNKILHNCFLEAENSLEKIIKEYG